MNYSEKVCAFCFSSLVLLLLLAVATQPVHGESLETSPPYEQSMSSESPSQTPSWSSLDQLLTMLESEAEASRTESTQLLSELLTSQIEANALQASLALSEQSRADLERSTKAERATAVKALESALREAKEANQRADWWRWAAIIAGALAASGWAAFGVAQVF